MSKPSIQATQEDLEEEFALFDDWRDKIDYIMDLGKNLTPLDPDDRTEANKVHGCQSQVWLVAKLDPDTARLQVRADSDAILVKGLIGLLLRLYDDRAPDEIVANPPDVFERIGLGRHLTPGRANGLYSMVKRIRDLARTAA